MPVPAETQLGSKPGHPQPDDLTKFIAKNVPDDLVAHGGFGSVYRCMYKRGKVSMDVAVKAIRPKGVTNEEALKREIGIWKRLCHDFIVPLLGITTHYSHMSLVLSWMPNGSLESYLTNHKISLTRRRELLCHIADGLQYLHSKSVVHGDLTSNNVLIDGQGQARLTDFGLSSMVKPGEKYQYLRQDGNQPGALWWAAPELLGFGTKETCIPFPSSDIYSYGRIIFQVLSDSMPPLTYHDICQGVAPSRPNSEHMQDEDWIFILQCWLSLPSLRPLASQALRFAQSRLSIPQVESYGKSKCASTYSAHLDGAIVYNLSSSNPSHLAPAFSDHMICWRSIDGLAEALISLFTTTQCQHGLDDVIQLYRVSLATLTPSFSCKALFDKIISAFTSTIIKQSGVNDPDATKQTMRSLRESDPVHLADTSSDALYRLQIALACAQIAENAQRAETSLEAYSTSLQLLESHISVTCTTAWAEPVKKLLTSTGVDAAVTALRLKNGRNGGNARKAVELLEWGKGLLWAYLVQSQTGGGSGNPMSAIPSGHLCPSFPDLLKAVRGGPVVMLVASKRSCDAIIVSNTSLQAHHISLNTSLDALKKLSATFNVCISSISASVEEKPSVGEKLKDILRRLWIDVVEPVTYHIQSGSRIWWCPTSVFSTLPIHAAGEYTLEGKRSSRRYVSSYTSSITSLSQLQRTGADRKSPSEFAAIYAPKPRNGEKEGVEYPTIGSAGLEPELVKHSLPPSIRFTRFCDATKDTAVEAFKHHGWFHLMGYVTKNGSQPLNPSFVMHDGLLSISDIVEANLGQKEFAFLSARPTGSQCNWMQHEITQFATGLQVSGFKSIVGMMYDIGDSEVIEKFYNKLFRAKPTESTRAAQALHDTLEEVANSDAGLSLRRRIAFAHFGL